MEQMFMFDVAPETVAPSKSCSTRRDFGPSPKQKALRIKLMRKIAFKQRYRELPGVGNDEAWSHDGILILHRALLADWEETFPSCTNTRQQIDYWTWMLGDPTAPFSFHDCLVVEGFTDPEMVIENLRKRAPTWWVDAQQYPDRQQLKIYKAAVNELGLNAPAAKAA
ncbi:MAG: hypothetical protein A2580_09170 [Hydrogenophilales bacterium RIFOXYD1_FULL_62_11]|nr:MAG: hypothetical protein A2580_09170 [Hydrogenophilales bacterium RIFOXYD1_FULL_62_11]